jgi:type II restriction enzyme
MSLPALAQAVLRETTPRMDLNFQPERVQILKGPTQKIRVLSEHWVSQQVFCPNCGHVNLTSYPANRPVADFFCSGCREEYELKALGRAVGPKVGDGAYRTMIERLSSNTNPSLLILHYDPTKLSVQNLMVIPKYFFVPQIIEQREPLAMTAKRAGWTGCNIALHGIPEAGRIFLIKNRLVEPKEHVLAKWRQTRFLREQKGLTSKGWLLSVMRCIEKLGSDTFTLQQCYEFEDQLRSIYPSNQHIKEKIRQKLQVLRDNGYLQFLGRGIYRVVAG